MVLSHAAGTASNRGLVICEAPTPSATPLACHAFAWAVLFGAPPPLGPSGQQPVMGLQLGVVDDAELGAIGVAQNNEVGVARVRPVVDSLRTQTDEARNVPVLLVGVQVEVKANRLLRRRLSLLQ